MNLSLKLEGSELDNYVSMLSKLLPLMLSKGNQDMLSSLFLEKTTRNLNDEQVLEAFHGQGGTLNDILKVIREFGVAPFSSKDIKNRYEERLNRPIQLSTVATYLMRLHDRGLLMRRKRGREYVYQAVAPISISPFNASTHP